MIFLINTKQNNDLFRVKSNSNNYFNYMDMTKEEWKKIPGFENYHISSFGNVKSKNRVLKKLLNGHGYEHVVLSKNGKSKTIRIHTLVMMAYKGYVPDGKMNAIIDHIDGNQLNNKLSNLRITTPSINTFKRKKYPTNKSGFRGVSFYSRYNKWQACISKNYKGYHLGYFENFSDAVKAREEAELKYYGFINKQQ